MVASAHELASQAGAAILKKGGNAVDAAVATSLALAVTRPQSSGLGGGGFMMIKAPGKRAVIIDYREKAPHKSSVDDYLIVTKKGIQVDSEKIKRGAFSVGVPGTLKGLAFALENHGSLSFKEVARPAIRLAKKGFRVDQNLHNSMKRLSDLFKQNPKWKRKFRETYRTFLRGGKAYPVGKKFKQPDLARTLRKISKEGPHIFYEGEIAKKITQEIRKRKGRLEGSDLKNYKIQLREPLKGEYGGYQFLTMPPPSSGGAVLIEILNVLKRYSLEEMSPSLYFHVLTEAMKHAFADRASYLGDSDDSLNGLFITRDVERMISEERADEIFSKIRETALPEAEDYGSGGVGRDAGTSHFSVVDSRGTAVACTETINLSFGSLITVKGTGILLNDEMDDFTLLSNVENEFGLIQSERNLLVAGRRPLSSMSPTLVLKEDEPILIIGSAGGPKIISSTLQVILNLLEFGQAPELAVTKPRLHHQWLPETLFVESEFPITLREELKKKGHRIEERESLGVVQFIVQGEGEVVGVSDPRGGGRPKPSMGIRFQLE